MAATDARPLPLKNVAYRYYFALFDVNGDPVSGPTGLDSEISQDGGTFTDVTPDEATEIATSSGAFYLDLTATEMNADSVVIKVTSSAKTHFGVLYPAEDGDIRVNLAEVIGNAVTVDANGLLDVNIEAINESLVAAINLSLGARGLTAFIVGAGSTTTTIETDLTETTNDHYKDSDVSFITGNLAGQYVSVSAYNGTTKQLTVGAATDAPATGSIAVIN